MKTWMVLPLCAAMAACGVSVEHDAKTGDVKDVHVSIGNFGNLHGDGKLKSEMRQIAAVKRIEVNGPGDVEIDVGGAPSLSVAGDDNLLRYVHTTQHDDSLVIDVEQSFTTSQPLKIRLSTPALVALRNLGSGDVEVKGLSGGDLDVDSTSSGDTTISGHVGNLKVHMVGSGDFDAETLAPGSVDLDVVGSGGAKFGALDVDHFNVKVKGSGDVTAEGRAKAVTADVLGSGDLTLVELKADDATLDLMGSGNIEAFATSSVHAHAAGSGEITVHGNPQKRDLSGENVHIE